MFKPYKEFLKKLKADLNQADYEDSRMDVESRMSMSRSERKQQVQDKKTRARANVRKLQAKIDEI